jgi:CBS domain-containing protein
LGAEKNASGCTRSATAGSDRFGNESLQAGAGVQDESSHGVMTADQAQLLMARRLDEVVHRAPVTCALATPIHDVLDTLHREHVGSMVVTFPDGRAAGIFTLHDLLTRVAVSARSTNDPIRAVMTPEPITLPAHVFAVDAALAMARHGVHHIVVVEGNQIIGLVSEKDLFALQQGGIRQISIALREAAGVSDLVDLSRSIRELARNLVQQGGSAENLTRIVASLNDALSQRIIELELAAAGLDATNLCWISLGSEGRQEQTLATDQDNGIIFADPADWNADAVRKRLLPIARKINEDLDACGFPLCRGNVMASNPRWCLSASEWREAFGRWIFDGNPDAVLNATIFFDFRALHGDASLAAELRRWLTIAAADNRRFLRYLAEDALRNRPPLGLVRDFALSRDAAHPHTIDLKVNGATLFIDAARVLALTAGIRETNTIRRINEWAGKVGVAAGERQAWTDAFDYLQLTRLRHQQAQIARGEAPDNHLNPDLLNRLDRRILRETLRLAKSLQSRVALDYLL